MANSFAAAIAAGLKSIRQLQSVAIQYWRGSTRLDLSQAAVGRTAFEGMDDSGVSRQWETRDYFVAVADLAIGDDRIEPAIGDVIIETIDGRDCSFQVLSIGPEKPWSFADPGRTEYRIHTKQIDQAPA